jgi:predicted Zn finger-like uncharacterized protein
MRIVCPECGAAYGVPDALIEPGKQVRCARCNAEWAPVPATPAVAPRAPAIERLEPSPSHEASPRPAPTVPAGGSLRVTSTTIERPRPPARDHRRAAVASAWLGWVLTIVVLACAAAAAVTWRGAVMASWPPSTRVYAALGLAPPGPK